MVVLDVDKEKSWSTTVVHMHNVARTPCSVVIRVVVKVILVGGLVGLSGEAQAYRTAPYKRNQCSAVTGQPEAISEVNATMPTLLQNAICWSLWAIKQIVPS